MGSESDNKKLRRKQRIMSWACKKSNQDISAKIDKLLFVITKCKDTEEVENAKFDAQELAKIVQKRTK